MPQKTFDVYDPACRVLVFHHHLARDELLDENCRCNNVASCSNIEEVRERALKSTRASISSVPISKYNGGMVKASGKW